MSVCVCVCVCMCLCMCVCVCVCVFVCVSVVREGVSESLCAEREDVRGERVYECEGRECM